MRAVDRWVRAAFFEPFLSFAFFPFRRRVSSLPPATNACRWGLFFSNHKRNVFCMNFLRSLSTNVLIATIFISVLAACSSAKDSESQSTDAINEIRTSLELPELPVELVENTGMANSPTGDLQVANYQDSEGRIYSVNPVTNQVVEIDARAILSNLSADTPSLSSDEIKAKVIAFAKTVLPDFDSRQSSLHYEEGGKVDNYFFTWYGETRSGLMNRPFLQFGFHKSGILFAYYNTLSLEK